MIRSIVISALVFVALGIRPTFAQFNVVWDVAEGDWNEAENWFDGIGPPDAQIDDVGIVSNGGIAFLEAPADTSAGGVVIGELGGQTGTVHIRSGGSLEVVDLGSPGIIGRVLVGQAGTGTLMVDRGGELTAESLWMGGGFGSTLVLGEGTSGTSTVNINGSALLTRQTRVIGSDVNFSADSLSLTGTLTTEISGADFSTFDINTTASLGGDLDVQFDTAPAVGATWDLIDAASISGDFSEITSNITLGPGLALNVNKVAGGQNGMLAQLSVDPRLQLTINRRTGETQIENLAQQSIMINGYGVGSASGQLNDANWQPLGGDWNGNGSSTHVSEINLTGSRELGSGADAMLGAIYNFQPAALGDANEDVFFEYHVDGGDVVQGSVDFTGPHNDVVLVVADDGAYIQNQSETPVTINGYAIVSREGSLDPNNWTSLSDGDNSWTEGNAASNHMTELNLGSTMTLPATSDPISLGDIIGDDADDLEFFINLADVGPHTATVEYDDGVIDFGGGGLCNPNTQGDLDGNGVVEFGDFLLLSANFGNDVTSHTEGDIDCNGKVEFADFLVLSANFGQEVGAQAVPEPSAVRLLLTSFLFVIGVRRKR